MDEFDPWEFDDKHLSPETKARLDAARERLGVVEKEAKRERLAALTEEPKCPECGVGACRQNCFLGFGGCSRHEVLDFFGGSKAISDHLKERLGG